MKKSTRIVLLLIILADIAYTFTQNYFMMQTEGDMAPIIMVSDGYREVMSDPFGFDVLFKGESYPATNRFFAHWTMAGAMKTTPLFFQSFTDPVSSIYLTLSFYRTLIQVALLYLLAVYASGSFKIMNRKFLVSSAIIFPLFQIGGYAHYMSLTYNSITYTFFYGLPFILMLLFFLPFALKYFHDRKPGFNIPFHVLMAVLIIFIAFGGPLGPPLMMIICPFVLFMFFVRAFKAQPEIAFREKLIRSIKAIPVPFLIYLLAMIFFSIYSYYLGRSNTENLWSDLSIMERYSKLPEGFFRTVFEKPGLPVLMVLCLINIILLIRDKSEMAGRLITFAKFMGLLSLIYILLLPFGGSREYRPFILRNDTFSPVTLSLMLFYGMSSVYLAFQLSGPRLKLYTIPLLAGGFIYLNADRIDLKGNECDREALEAFAGSEEKIVRLGPDCTPLSWVAIDNPENSRLNVALLRQWNVVEEEKLYFNKDKN